LGRRKLTRGYTMFVLLLAALDVLASRRSKARKA
jgi:hypothetical protein